MTVHFDSAVRTDCKTDKIHVLHHCQIFRFIISTNNKERQKSPGAEQENSMNGTIISKNRRRLDDANIHQGRLSAL